MTSAKIYPKDDFWCVDYIDSNYQALPTVGIFKTLEEARQSALVWAEGEVKNVAIVGKSTW
jgi:hypothetical protein